jgi:hypothetical protein
MCRAPHALQLRELNIEGATLRGADLRALATVPTLTALRPSAMALEPKDLPFLAWMTQLRSLRWRLADHRPSLSVKQSLGAVSSLTQLTSLNFHNDRCSEEELAQLLAPLRQLQEL